MGSGRPVTKIQLKYVAEDIDRHGNVRRYFRREGQRKIRLPGLPGSAEFMDAYRAALCGESAPTNPRQLATNERPKAPSGGSVKCILNQANSRGDRQQ